MENDGTVTEKSVLDLQPKEILAQSTVLYMIVLQWFESYCVTQFSSGLRDFCVVGRGVEDVVCKV